MTDGLARLRPRRKRVWISVNCRRTARAHPFPRLMARQWAGDFSNELFLRYGSARLLLIHGATLDDAIGRHPFRAGCDAPFLLAGIGRVVGAKVVASEPLFTIIGAHGIKSLCDACWLKISQRSPNFLSCYLRPAPRMTSVYELMNGLGHILRVVGTRSAQRRSAGQHSA